MRVFGIIGWPLDFSLSKKYFDEKFAAAGLSDECRYYLFPLENIEGLASVLAAYPDLAGFNVTIPYKKEVVGWLDEISDEAQAIGAVNCVKVVRVPDGDGVRLVGYNTDAYGFRVGLERLLGISDALIPLTRRPLPVGLRALVLGTGGAAAAVQWVLRSIGVGYRLVSRTAGEGVLSYGELTEELIASHRLIINTTPSGMFPNIGDKPSLPYETIGKGHYLYDLIYNPVETAFMQEGARRGAATIGGETMLYAQAGRNWEIWNDL